MFGVPSLNKTDGRRCSKFSGAGPFLRLFWGRPVNRVGLKSVLACVRLAGVVCVVMISGILAVGAVAQSNTTWTGAAGNWSNAADWNNGVPNGNFNALISNGNPGVKTVNLDMNVTVANLGLDSQNTLDILAGKTLTFQTSGGSTVAGGGTINLASGGSIVVGSGNSLTADSTINMSGANSLITGATGAETFFGSVTGSGTISDLQVLSGNVIASGGTLTIKPNSQGFGAGNFLEVTKGSTLNISGGPFLNFDPTTGTLSQVGGGVFPGQGIYLRGTLKFDNANVLQLSDNESLTLDGAGARIVNQNNQNALAHLDSLGIIGHLTLVNGASLTTVTKLGAVDHNSITVMSGSKLSIGGDLGLSTDGGTVAGVLVDHGTLSVAGNVSSFGGDTDSTMLVRNQGSLKVQGSYSQGGALFGASLALSAKSAGDIGGDFNNQGFAGFGTFTTLSDHSSLNVEGTLNNSGNAQVTLAGGSTLNVGKDFNQTVFSNCNCTPAPLLALSGGSSMNVHGSVSNAGMIQIDDTSKLTVKSGFSQSGGSTVVDGVLNSKMGAGIQGGMLSGTGILNGNLKMAGTMMPGDPTGTFTLNGNYAQTSGGTLAEQVGWLSGSNATLFKVNGKVTLAGTLALSLLSGYNPTVGDSFILMTFLSDTGVFGTITGTDLGNGRFLDVIYDPHDVRLEVEAPVGTPEPSSTVLLLAGCLLLLAFARKRLANRVLPVIS